VGEVMTGLGERIRNIRKAIGITQGTLAHQLGLAISTISGYEREIIVPPFQTLKTIATIANISVGQLVNGGTTFDEVIGKKANQIISRRMRNDNNYNLDPSAGDIKLLIQRLESIKEDIESTTTKLIQNGSNQLTSTEQRMLIAFRRLGSITQNRIVEDLEER
jgi:transcriptional regulator with XRE-family HTH domain